MNEWFAVISITTLAVISPGPDFAMVIRNSINLSKRAGVLTALGIGAGVLVHVGYTLLGIGVLIQQSPLLFSALKLVGAAYLVWLGIKMLLTRKALEDSEKVEVAVSDLAAFRIGFFTNSLNPKTTIFILSLFMQVVQLSTPLMTKISYGLFISLAHVFWFAAVGLFFGAPRMRETFLRFQLWIDRAFGCLLVGFGISLSVANLS